MQDERNNIVPQVKTASNLLFGLCGLHSIVIIGLVVFSWSEFQHPPGSEQRVWAAMPLFLAALLAIWTSVSFVAAVGLKKGKPYGWIMGLVFCIVNAAFSLGGLMIIMAPVYIGVIWYLCRKPTREHYMSMGTNSVED